LGKKRAASLGWWNAATGRNAGEVRQAFSYEGFSMFQRDAMAINHPLDDKLSRFRSEAEMFGEAQMIKPGSRR